MTEKEMERMAFNACAAAVGGDGIEGWRERVAHAVRDGRDVETGLSPEDVERLIKERDLRVDVWVLEGVQTFLNHLEAEPLALRPLGPERRHKRCRSRRLR